MPSVHRSELGRNLVQIGDGAYGTVYQTRYKPPGEPSDLVYKEYKLDSAGNRVKSGASAEHAVKFREMYRRFLRTELEVLDRYFAWPRRLVLDDSGELCGFVMEAASSDYFYWHGIKQAYELRTLDLLAVPEQFWIRNKSEPIDITLTDRLFLMMQLVYAVAWLHKRGWVFGDLSFKNVAFTENPPQLVLIDCDEANELADPQREQQSNTSFWVPPECSSGRQQEQDKVTDVYKLGVAIVRCLKAEAGATTTFVVDRLAGILDPEGLQLLERALSDDRAHRPSAKELFAYLERVTVPRMVPPEIVGAQLMTPMVLAGSRGRILWTIKDAEDIEVFIGEPPQSVETFDPFDHPDEGAFPVPSSGQVTLVASNRYGSVARPIGDVTLFEIPPMNVDFDQMPRPDLPSVQALSLGPLPRPPAYSQGPELPGIPPLDVAESLRDLAPAPPAEAPDLGINLLFGSSRALIESIHNETESQMAGLRRKMKRRGSLRRGR